MVQVLDDIFVLILWGTYRVIYCDTYKQTKLETEAAAAEDGWTVVVNKGGRKKTTDDSGIAVGAVALEAAAEHAKKKQKTEVAVDFYRFQRREVRRNGMSSTSPFQMLVTLWSRTMTEI